MPRASRPTPIRVIPRAAHEFTDSQIETLMSFGRREAELIDELEDAVRHNDKDLAWQIAQAICRIEDRVKGSPAGDESGRADDPTNVRTTK